MPPAVVSETLANQIAEQLRSQIVNGDLSPGEELNVSRLAREIGVSRTPVREALRTLAAEDLIVFESRRSPSVADITEQDIRDIYPCRANLLGLAIERAASRITPETLERLRALVRAMEEACDISDHGAYFALSTQFNDEIISCASNPVLTELLELLERRTTLRLRRLSIMPDGRVEAGVKRHREIVKALAGSDRAQGRKAMERLIRGARDALLETYFEQQGDDANSAA